MTSGAMPPLDELRPRRIAALAADPGIILIPVSPLHEWHSWHLPVGVDGLIAEGAARATAEVLGCAWCRCLPIALDEVRGLAFKEMMGLPAEAHVFGMNFPGLPFTSEYHEEVDLRRMVLARLAHLRQSGFRRAYIINHHGGVGQAPTLEDSCRIASDGDFTARALFTYRHARVACSGWDATCLSVGGHAGMSETLQLLAFRPDLVDLGELPEGDLAVATTGILHNRPLIPAELNPRRAPVVLAQAWRTALIDGLVAAIRAATLSDGAL